MVNSSQKIITLFSLLSFLLAGNSSALCMFNFAADPGSSPSSFTETKKISQVVTVSAVKNKENPTGHKTIPPLKQRFRGKRSTTSLSTIETSVTRTSILPYLLFPGHLLYDSTSTWQNSSLRNLKTVVLLVYAETFAHHSL